MTPKMCASPLILTFALVALQATAGNVITNVHDLAAASKALRIKLAEFDLEATVAATVPGSSKLVLADGNDFALVSTVNEPRVAPPVKIGDRVHIRGKLSYTRPNAAPANCESIETIGKGNPPIARDVGFREILYGECDWHWVRVSGLVRDVSQSETSEKWVILVLCADGESLNVSMFVGNSPASELSRLIGCEIEICGFANPQTGSWRRYAGRFFQCPDPSLATVRKTPDSPFAAHHISDLRYRTPSQIASFGRVKAKGVAIARWGEHNALVHARAFGIIHIVCDTDKPPRRGQSIEVAGFPLSNLFNLTLNHAVWRETSPIAMRDQKVSVFSAKDILPKDITQGSRKAWLHGRTIRMTGTVYSLPNQRFRKDTLLVENSGQIVSVVDGGDVSAFTGLSIGCEVEITGVCALDFKTYQPDRIFPQIEDFTIIVQDPGEIRVVSRPSWWTPARLWSFVGTLIACLLGIFAWNIALRKAAARKGRELMREQLEHEKSRLKTSERTRLAVELHDSIAQSLTGVSLEIDTAERMSRDASDGMRAHLRTAANALKACRDELKNCLWDLRSRALESRDMNDAISQTLAPHLSGSGVQIDFAVPRARLSDNTAHTILRIVRELVINAVRHGHADEIWIAGSIDGTLLRFSVRDNGCGFDPASAPGFSDGHYGLLGIQERVDEFEGEFEIDSNAGSGTTATVSFSLRNESGGASEDRP